MRVVKRRYNYKHSRIRIIVKCAFGRLIYRFRILLAKQEQKTKAHVANVIGATCVLHNILTSLNDSEHVTGDDPLLREAPPPAPEDDVKMETPLSHTQGEAKRDDLAKIFKITQVKVAVGPRMNQSGGEYETARSVQGQRYCKHGSRMISASRHSQLSTRSYVSRFIQASVGPPGTAHANQRATRQKEHRDGGAMMPVGDWNTEVSKLRLKWRI
ncbi:hypothetical protein JG688_00014474 [Phytophthora aleatoria]|uniref:DDE Tnp4 domain-containing protein n=1 Tax=Phytophthora aleatoria TaxID=2496075 RepID=A0A8J5M0F4_9STRA|nr:hypothetical protein JG688_00014474 [Phytophthora aleatoria]